MKSIWASPPMTHLTSLGASTVVNVKVFLGILVPWAAQSPTRDPGRAQDHPHTWELVSCTCR